jgi:hypothetical protein
MDGGFGFAEVILEGLFGLKAKAAYVSLYPRIPTNFGELFITDLNVQKHKFDVHIDAQNTVHLVDMCVNCGRQADGAPATQATLSYGTEIAKKVVFLFRNLQAGTYQLTLDNVNIGSVDAQNNIVVYIHEAWDGEQKLSLQKM